MIRAEHVAHMTVPLPRLNDVIQVEFVTNKVKLVKTLG